jgi:hypothetical protein
MKELQQQKGLPSHDVTGFSTLKHTLFNPPPPVTGLSILEQALFPSHAVTGLGMLEQALFPSLAVTGFGI